MYQGNRRQGREYALKIIYGFTGGEQELQGALNSFWKNFRFQDDILGEPLDDAEAPVVPQAREFAERLVRGVVEHRDQLDAAIRDHCTNWSLDRMARVDLSILRLGAFELLHLTDVPASVAINEAIEIAKRYGTKESPAFVNGILDNIARSHRSEKR